MKQVQLLPQINPNDDRVEVVHLYCKSGDFVKAGDTIVDLGTSKATVATVAEFGGYIKFHCKPGEKIQVGKPLASFFSEKSELENDKAVIEQIASAPKASSLVSSRDKLTASGNFVEAVKKAGSPPDLSRKFSFVRFTPHAEAMLQQDGIEKAQFKGLGIVNRRVVEAFLAAQKQADSIKVAAADERLRKTPILGPKGLEIRQLSIGQAGQINSTLSVQFFAEKIFSKLREKNLFNGSILPIILYETAQVLKKFPLLTAYYENNHIFYYDSINLGVAIDLGNGLKVVTLRQTPEMLPIKIFESLTDFAIRDIHGELKEVDLIDSTFTVTDLTAQNIHHFVPLINGRQSGILGIGGDSNLPNHPISLTLTFDHRVLTGREGAIFLDSLRKRILAFE